MANKTTKSTLIPGHAAGTGTPNPGAAPGSGTPIHHINATPGKNGNSSGGTPQRTATTSRVGKGGNW